MVKSEFSTTRRTAIALDAATLASCVKGVTKACAPDDIIRIWTVATRRKMFGPAWETTEGLVCQTHRVPHLCREEVGPAQTCDTLKR